MGVLDPSEIQRVLNQAYEVTMPTNLKTPTSPAIAAKQKAAELVNVLDDLATGLEMPEKLNDRNLEREIYLLYVRSLKVRKLLVDKETN